jgi:MOSC domain-containing protein YiiM
MAEVLSINISERTGVPKRPVGEAELLPGGIRGDAHFGLSPVKEVSLLADESADKMRALGLALAPGAFAENITTSGINLKELPVGTRLHIGATIHEVSQIGKECHAGCAIKQQTGTCVMPTEGIFTKVIKGGTIRPGDEIALMPTPKES